MKLHMIPRLIGSALAVAILTIAPVRADYLSTPIHETIDGGIAAFVERSIETAERDGMDGIIFRIDTPGGRIDSAVEIKDAILNARIPTIAFIDKNAISAGSLISLACDSIYMATGASIGAATAVDLEGKKASEKIISYFRAQMRATAEANGRRADIAEAMVDEQLEIEGITKKGQLVTLTYTEALAYGISDGTIDSIDEVLARIGGSDAKAAEFRMNWTEHVVRFLTNPIVSSLLMSLGFIGLLIELKTPGWGLGGLIALIALTLFFGSHYIVRLAGIGELLLFTAGIVLLLLEIFVIPGFGVAGVSGIALIVTSFFLSLVGSWPTRDVFLRAGYTVGWSFIITFVLGIMVIKLLPKSSLFHKITLNEAQHSTDGYTSAPSRAELLGKTGRALTTLRPAGTVEIDGKRIDVITEGGYIAQDAGIIVARVEGSKVVVRENPEKNA
jgi:membrane-bound serine protease (ClpP class)